MSELSDNIFSKWDEAQSNAVGSIADDPEKAARAIQLSNSAGVDPSIVYGDVENFEQQHKQQMAGSLIDGNPHLAEYVNSHPLAPKISNDDYGNLNTISDKVKRFAKITMPIFGAGASIAESIPEMGKAYKEMGDAIAQIGVDNSGTSDGQAYQQKIEDYLLGTGMEPKQAKAEAIHQRQNYQRQAGLMTLLMTGGVAALGAGEAAGAALFPALQGIFRKQIGEPLETSIGMPKELSEQLAMVVAGGFGLKGLHTEAMKQQKASDALTKKFQDISDAMDAATPFLDAGKESPAGLHPILDDLKADQAKLDAKNLDEALSESQTSTTRERSPEMFADFIRQHTDQQIRIPVDAVLELYGGKEMHPEDNLLGWVPNIERQVDAAAATGGDVTIPLADWLARVESETAKALKEDIRFRENGLTLNEAKEMPKALGAKGEIEAYHGSPHEFDAFSMEKIGTGEGAQSYGHGLYFAEKEAVSKEYQRAGGARIRIASGETFRDQREAAQAIAKTDDVDVLFPLQWGITKVFLEGKNIDEAIRDMGSNYSHFPSAKVNKAASLLREASPTGSIQGNLYRVRIKADKEHFLDWDKRIDEQHPEVKAKLKTLGFESERGTEMFDDISGQDVYRRFTTYHGFKTDVASAEFAKAGIPGIKYLDQGSRFAKPNIELAERWLEDAKAKGDPAEIAKYEARLAEEQAKDTESHNFVLFDDSLVEILDRNGQAIKAVRTAAGLDRPFDVLPKAPELTFGPAQDFNIHSIDGKEYKAKSVGTSSLKDMLNLTDFTGISGLFKWYKETLSDMVNKHAGDTPVHILSDEEFARITGDAVNPAFYDPNTHNIVLKASSPNLPTDLIHESIHAATARILETEPELLDKVSALMKEVKDFHPEIIEEYGFQNEHEFLAEAFSDSKFQAKLARANISKELADNLGITKDNPTMWDAFIGILKKALGIGDDQVTALEAAVRLGEEIANTKISDKALAKAERIQKSMVFAAKEPELPGTRRVEDQEPFKTPGAVGMGATEFNRLMRLIEQQKQEDQAAQLKRAEAAERKRQTKEWKENEARVREEVSKGLSDNQHLNAFEFFSSAMLDGEKVNRTPMNEDLLTPEQKAALPKEFYGKGGINPDDIATHLGYDSGEQMINRLAMMKEAMGEATPKAYLKGLIEDQTKNVMERRFGDLNKNILDEAKEHVFSRTQLDILHEQTLLLATQAKAEFSFSREDMAKWAKQAIKGITADSVDSDVYINEAGKAGRAVREALIGGDYAEAFKQQQRQYLASLLQKEAMKFEKVRAKLERTTERFKSAQVKNFPQEYTNWIHDIMQRTGFEVRRNDLWNDINEHQAIKSLRDFWVNRNERGLPEGFKEYDVEYNPSLVIAEHLMDPNFRKPHQKMTVEEITAINDSLKSLVTNGRNEGKIIREGEAFDYEALRDKMINQLSILGEKKQHYNPGRTRRAITFIKTMHAGLLQLESLFDRFDSGDPRGLFTTHIWNDLADAGQNYSGLQRKYSARLRKLAEFKTKLNDKLSNDVFKDPISVMNGDWENTGSYRPITRANLRGVLLNVGNESNMAKLANGYHTTPEKIMQWVNKYATKEDWDWAQAAGNIFSDIQKEADRMTFAMSGSTIEKLPLKPIQTPHGEYRGWYYPAIRDRTVETVKGEIDDMPFVRPMTPRGHEKARTGAIYPLDLSINNFDTHISRRLKDIAFRPAIMTSGKFMLDPKFRNAITKYYGKHYSDLLVPYLKDIAGQSNLKSGFAQAGEKIMDYVRTNTVGTLIGWNPSTPLKHGPTAFFNSIAEVGAANFARAAFDLYRTNDVTAKSNNKFILEGGQIGDLEWKGSEEVNRRAQHWIETLGPSQDLILGEPTTRQSALEWGSKMVALSDMLSTKPTWLAQYRETFNESRIERPDWSIEQMHTDAARMADRAVRRAHGSTAITSRPAAMRGGALSRTLTSLYGFFNHIYQRYYRMSWEAKEAAGMIKAGDVEKGAAEYGRLAKAFVYYAVIPAMIEEAVTPLTTDDHRGGYLARLGKSMLMGLGHVVTGTAPVIRDVAHAALSGMDPSVGLLGTDAKAVTDLVRDLKKGVNKQNIGSVIKHSMILGGVTTGLTTGAQGRAAEFITRYNLGQEPTPKGIFFGKGMFGKDWTPVGEGTWLDALRRGTLKERRK